MKGSLGLCFACCAWVFLAAGCDQKKRSEDEIPMAPRTVSLKIVHDPGLRPYLESVKEQFGLEKPALSDGTPIYLEFIPQLGVNAAKKIASGEIKADAWLAPSASLIHYVNSHLQNLGARQSDCVAIFSTPVVIATDDRNQNNFSAHNQEFSWNLLSDTKLALDIDAPVATRYAYSHGAPDGSLTGFDALLQLAYLASVDAGLALSLQNLKLAQSMAQLEEYERFVSSYGMDETVLLERTANSGTKRVRFTITTEQQVAMFNVNRAETTNPLVALYPEEGSLWQEYTICFSEADWVTPAYRAALKIFANYMASAPSQAAAKKRGFRPTIMSIPEEEPLSERYGVNTSLPKKSFAPVSGDVVDFLLTQWPTLMRPSASVLLLDTSGSMDGAPLSEAKEFFRKALARASSRDRRALVTFSTRPRIESRLTDDIRLLTSRVDATTAVGGSAVYDGLRTAIELITAPEANPFRRSIVVITDGDDKNSETSAQMIQDLVSDKFARYDINLIMIALTRPGADYADLKRLARAANGIYREGSFDQMSSIFDEVAKNF